MISKAMSTLISRILIALSNFAILIILSRNIGAQGVGTVALIVLGISINLLFANIFSASLVYLVPRKPLLLLLLPAWIWTAFVSIVCSFTMSYFKIIPEKYTIDIIFLTFLQGSFQINQSVLLAKEKINIYNIASVMQILTSLTATSLLFYFKEKDINSYILSLYISFATIVIIGLMIILKYITITFKGFFKTLKESFKYGSYMQMANFMQLFNYRFSYILIEKYFDRATLGVFSAGSQLAESIWTISKSIGIVLYSRVSNSNNIDESHKLTIDFSKFSFLSTALLLLVLLLIPSSLFRYVFGDNFANISIVIAALSTGILSIALSVLLSNFFVGSGRPWYNTISSGLGLVVTIVIGLIAIPKLGVIGAGITASLSYLISYVFQWIIFIKNANVNKFYFLPKQSDIRQFKLLIKNLLVLKK